MIHVAQSGRASGGNEVAIPAEDSIKPLSVIPEGRRFESVHGSYLLIYLNSSNMKELIDIFKKDIEPEKFNDLECVVFGFVVPAAFLALCLVISLL